MKHRIIAFDLLKLFAIFLVIEGHCTQHLLSSFEYDEPVYLYIYSFHMPLFMFLAGFFSYKNTIDVKTALGGVNRRFLQLIIPSVFAMILHLLLLVIINNDISLLSSHVVWKSELFSTLWFLKSLFICYVVYMVIYFIPRPYSIIALLITVLMLSTINCFRLLYMFPSFIIGVSARKYNVFFKINKIILIISFPLFVVCLLYWNSNSFYLPLFSFRSLLNGANGALASLVVFLNHYLYVLLTGISGTLFCSSFFVVFCGKINHNPLVQKISEYGTYTLGIYILQTFLLETILPHYITLDIYYSTFMCNVLIIPLISLFIILLSILLIKFLSKNRVLSLLLGYV